MSSDEDTETITFFSNVPANKNREWIHARKFLQKIEGTVAVNTEKMRLTDIPGSIVIQKRKTEGKQEDQGCLQVVEADVNSEQYLYSIGNYGLFATSNELQLALRYSQIKGTSSGLLFHLIDLQEPCYEVYKHANTKLTFLMKLTCPALFTGAGRHSLIDPFHVDANMVLFTLPKADSSESFSILCLDLNNKTYKLKKIATQGSIQASSYCRKHLFFMEDKVVANIRNYVTLNKIQLVRVNAKNFKEMKKSHWSQEYYLSENFQFVVNDQIVWLVRERNTDPKTGKMEVVLTEREETEISAWLISICPRTLNITDRISVNCSSYKGDGIPLVLPFTVKGISMLLADCSTEVTIVTCMKGKLLSARSIPRTGCIPVYLQQGFGFFIATNGIDQIILKDFWNMEQTVLNF